MGAGGSPVSANARGHACSVGLVADVMRERGLRAVQPRAYRVTTVHGDADAYPADLIERDFTSDEPGTRLVGDITYLRTGEGWLYLATVIDVATRMVIRLADGRSHAHVPGDRGVADGSPARSPHTRGDRASRPGHPGAHPLTTPRSASSSARC